MIVSFEKPDVGGTDRLPMATSRAPSIGRSSQPLIAFAVTSGSRCVGIGTSGLPAARNPSVQLVEAVPVVGPAEAYSHRP